MAETLANDHLPIPNKERKNSYFTPPSAGELLVKCNWWERAKHAGGSQLSSLILHQLVFGKLLVFLWFFLIVLQPLESPPLTIGKMQCAEDLHCALEYYCWIGFFWNVSMFQFFFYINILVVFILYILALFSFIVKFFRRLFAMQPYKLQ